MPQRSNMKTRIHNHFDTGIFLLILLTIAVVASQAQLVRNEPATAERAFDLDRHIEVEYSIDASAAPSPENTDKKNAPAQ